jgi:hypothetical protein
MARLLERDEPEEKHLRLELSERFKRKLVIVASSWTAWTVVSGHSVQQKYLVVN